MIQVKTITEHYSDVLEARTNEALSVLQQTGHVIQDIKYQLQPGLCSAMIIYSDPNVGDKKE